MYLRPYEAKDLEGLYALDLVCFEPRFRFSRSMMRAVVSARNSVVTLACDPDGQNGESLAGFAVINVEHISSSVIGYVSTLDVAPRYRGQGLGRVLMTASESEVALQGAGWMELHVFVENSTAQRLYERLGYTRVSREQGFYGAGFDAWLYRKQLPSNDAGPDRA